MWPRGSRPRALGWFLWFRCPLRFHGLALCSPPMPLLPFPFFFLRSSSLPWVLVGFLSDCPALSGPPSRPDSLPVLEPFPPFRPPPSVFPTPFSPSPPLKPRGFHPLSLLLEARFGRPPTPSFTPLPLPRPKDRGLSTPLRGPRGEPVGGLPTPLLEGVGGLSPKRGGEVGFLREVGEGGKSGREYE